MAKHTIPSRTNVPGTIFVTLLINEKLTFSQLQDTTKVSRPALSNHLSKMVNDGILESTKSGRNKFYRLYKNNSNTEQKITTLSTFYNVGFAQWLESKKNSHYIQDEYSNIGKFINAYFLFLVLKSLETGENWMKGFDSSILTHIVSKYLFQLLVGDNVELFLNSFNIDKDLTRVLTKNMSQEIKETKSEKKLSNWIKSLKEIYPTELKMIEEIMKKRVF